MGPTDLRPPPPVQVGGSSLATTGGAAGLRKNQQRRSPLQGEFARDGGVIASTGACISAVMVSPMCSSIQNVIQAGIPRIAPRRVGVDEAVGLQIALEATTRDPAKTGSKG